MTRRVPLPADHPLRPMLEAARVVIVASELTETVALERRLAMRGIDHRRLVMGMASAEMRWRFRELQQATGWPTLPMVFVDGEFLGGGRELDAWLDGTGPAPVSLPRAAIPMGYAGLLPFAGLAVGTWVGPWAAQAGSALAAWGALILAFLGGIHWGVVLRRPGPTPVRILVLGILAPLAAWLALVVAPWLSLLAVAAGLWGLWFLERRLPLGRVSPEWRLLRTRLTAIASLCLLAGALGLVRPDAGPVVTGPAGTGGERPPTTDYLICSAPTGPEPEHYSNA